MRHPQTFRISNLSPPSSRFDLAAGQYRFLAAKPDQTIYCLQGGLWLTQEQDARDYLLQEGDAFIVPRPGKVMVQALGRSCVGLSPKALDDEPFRGGYSPGLLK